MFTLITFCCVRAVAGGDLIDCDCVDVASGAGYANGFGGDIHGAAANSFDDEHSERVSLCLVRDYVWIKSKA